MQYSITAIILTKNEERMLSACLQSLQWCDHILVVDGGSTDRTVALAEAAGAKVVHISHPSFAHRRTEALKAVSTDWVVYIDADERVTPTLAKELCVQIETSDATALRMRRENVCYGAVFAHGGWEADYVTRAFLRTSLSHWEGDIHESPVYTGTVITVKTPLVHHTHRSTAEGLQKSAVWTLQEALLLAKANTPPVTFVTLIRKGVMEFIRRALLQRGYRDGMPGLIEAVVQGINRVLVYVQVWELQQHPLLNDQYQKRDADIQALWKAEQELNSVDNGGKKQQTDSTA